MCLDIITTPKKLNTQGMGYKIFHKTKRGNLYFYYSGIGKQVPLPIETWLNEKKYRSSVDKKTETILTTSASYPMGFHIYLNKKLVSGCLYGRDVIVSVKFRKAHTKGKQDGKNIIVAKEIFIPKEA